MNKRFLWLLVALPFLLSRCAVTKQISEAKTLADCKYQVVSADSIYLAGMNIRQLPTLDDLNPLKHPKLAAALLLRNVPLDTRLNLAITNPTARLAGINQLEYKVLLAGQELFQGMLNQAIRVEPNNGTTNVPVRLRANAYKLLTDDTTHDAFVALIQNLSGRGGSKPSVLTIKLKPMVDLNGNSVNYPGYITINQEITKDFADKIISGQ